LRCLGHHNYPVKGEGSMTPRKTPAAGVPVLDDDDWENSEVREAPTRPPTIPGQPVGAASARKALAQIGELKKTFEKFEERQYERDQMMLQKFEEHAKEDRAMFAKLGDKIDSSNGSMSDLRELTAAQTVELRQIRHDLKNRAMIEIETQKAEAEIKV